MMRHDGAGGLLRINLVVLGEIAPDASGLKESPEDFVIAHVGAGGVAEGVA